MGLLFDVFRYFQFQLCEVFLAGMTSYHVRFLGDIFFAKFIVNNGISKACRTELPRRVLFTNKTEKEMELSMVFH